MKAHTAMPHTPHAYVFPAPAPVSIPVQGSHLYFPVHRIYCVGRNYADHAIEMGHSAREAPFFFMKPADAVLVAKPGETAVMPYPTLTTDLHYELELVIAIGKGGSGILASDAQQHIYGYAVGLDMTRRDLQSAMKQQGRPWCISKGFDHSAPIGAITPAAQAPHIHNAEICLSLNGQKRQNSTVNQMIWSIEEIIEQLSSAWTLQTGDLIYTGTPKGVGSVVHGDVLTGQISGLQCVSVRIQ